MTDTTYDNSTELDPRIAARLKRDAKGLVAAVIQQYAVSYTHLTLPTRWSV